jgi:uncharacterized protein
MKSIAQSAKRLRNLDIQDKERRLIEILKTQGSIIVAYSGGVDSSTLAYYASQHLGSLAKIVIAISASLAQDELAAAKSQAKLCKWDLIEIETGEVEKDEYRRNDAMRCYFCKSTLFQDLQLLAGKLGISSIAYGANMDDLSDFRPGHQAASEMHILSPLQEAGLTKGEIRQLAKKANLPSWDRPQAACLFSRFPTFIPVTVEALTQVDHAESFIRSLGFKQVRVRHYNDSAKVEIELSELQRFENEPGLFDSVREKLKCFGYHKIDLDPEGYRQGSVNISFRSQ